MPSPRASGDATTLALLHDMLGYVERELRLMDAPATDAAAAVRRATNSVKATMRERSGKRRSATRRS